jgi:hypothetical protein
MKGKVLKTAATAAVLCVFAIGGYVLKMWATPAIGVHRTLIGRGTYDGFMVNTDQNQTLNPTDPTVKPFQYIAKAQALDKTDPAIDVEVDTHLYDPLGSTGWHKHPGPVYITVTSGQLTFYEFDDPTCSPHVYSKGQGFVDFGSGHIGINQDSINSASDVTVAILRSEVCSAPSFRLGIPIVASDDRGDICASEGPNSSPPRNLL